MDEHVTTATPDDSEALLPLVVAFYVESGFATPHDRLAANLAHFDLTAST